MQTKFLFIFLFLTLNLYSHTLLLNVYDNEDNTITIMGGFNTGDSATGAMVRLESLVSGDILYKKRLPDESEVTVNIPKEEYQVVLDGGPGHILVEKGIAPINGFEIKAKNTEKNKVTQAENKKETLSSTLIFLLSIGFILIILTLYFSFRNTNKLIEELKNVQNIK